MDFSSGALTPLHIFSLAGNSAYSSSVISAHVPSQLYSDPTGNLKINIDWLRDQVRSGQNYHIVETEDKPEFQRQALEEKHEIQSNALEEKLELIKTVFSMTEVEIAQSIGVARKTLFNWKRKEFPPNKKKAQNIFDLYLLAKNWKDSGFTTDAFELSLPVIDGQSIKDLLKEDKLDSEKILFAGNRLNHKNLDEIELF